MPGSATTAWLVGKQSFTPVSFTYTNTTPGTGSVTVPADATQLIVEVWGPGGGGGGAYTTAPDEANGGAGGGGSYSKITKTLTSGDVGKTVSYSLGTRGSAGTNSGTTPTAGGNATSSTSSTTGFSFGSFTLTVPGGGGGAAAAASSPGTGGGGGSAPTGGDVNTAGNSAVDDVPGAARVGDGGVTGGAGGAAGNGFIPTAPTIGGDSKVVIRFT